MTTKNPATCAGSILGTLFFLLYINDLPGSINHICTSTLFADDTNIICTQLNRNNFKDEIEIILQEITKWFKANLLHLNLKKTNFTQFSAKKGNNVLNSIVCGKNAILNSKALTFWV